MSRRSRPYVLGPAAVILALAISACGIASKPEAGSPQAIARSRAGVDDARTTHVACLRSEHIPVYTWGAHHVWMQIGSAPSGPTVQFTPTPGAAQEAQISGQVQGAEVIGSALLYPNQAPDGLLSQVEACIAKGVTG